MNKTAIEWTDYTWNPITGCTNGCEYCYARKIAERFKGGKAFPNGFKPTFHPERLQEVMPVGKKVFPCSMGELYMRGYEDWTEQVLECIRRNPQTTFITLTKQPQNLQQWSPFPDNCWVGVSATDNDRCSEAFGYLDDIEAKVKFISLEPLLEWVSPRPFEAMASYRLIDWLIIGAQTNPYRPPRVEWVKDIVKACNKGGVPVFLKYNLQPVWLGKLRQEFPKVNLG